MVYNLRVADWHTYFVGCGEWGFSVWAHNLNPCVLDPAILFEKAMIDKGFTHKVVEGGNTMFLMPAAVTKMNAANAAAEKAAAAASAAKTAKPTLYSSPKHHPNSNSPEPPNVADLYAKAVQDSKGRWWAKGPDGTIHRFQGSDGRVHWNGSSRTKEAPIQPNDIPQEIKDAFK